jgi:Zn-dependent M28 family amino/carboxypeptidase
MVRLFSTLSLLALSTVAAAQTSPKPTPAEVNARVNAPLPADQAAVKAHVMFLASDALKGREAGSPEYDIAAQYVAAQFYAAGLKPAGDDGGYLQRVPLVGYKVAGEGRATLTRGGAAEPLKFGVDYIPGANPARAKTDVSAPVVFAGYGVVAPAYGRDDYRGLDVRGKIVALVAGTPSKMSGEERAFFGSPATKATLAGMRGAAGVVMLSTPRSEKLRPFAKSVEGYQSVRMTWAKPDGTGNLDADAAPILATLSTAGAAKLFAGAKTGWSKVSKEAAKADARFVSEALPGTLVVASETTFTPATSSNVIGMIPGSDPVLGKEVVVLSAHLDHIGVSKKPVNEDAINNGALDDAIGIASLVEEAKRFKGAGAPKRSVMFLAVTAEEKGLVGSDYFANHPTVPLDTIVADVNLDMPILTYKFEDMVAFGGDRSSLGPIVRRAVGAIGVELSPDPIPDEGIFVRSDHFRFVEKGIPSVFLWPGHKGPGKAATTAFLSTDYHKPSDDLTQPILWDQAVRFVDANYRIARDIADAPTRPVWNKGDYFGTLFKGPMAAQ